MRTEYTNFFFVVIILFVLPPKKNRTHQKRSVHVFFFIMRGEYRYRLRNDGTKETRQTAREENERQWTAKKMKEIHRTE